MKRRSKASWKALIAASTCTVVLVIDVGCVTAAIVSFFNDRSLFEATLRSSTLIDFEGLVADDKTTVNPVTLVEVIDGVTFSVPSGAIAISGKNGEFMQDAPFDSALLFSNDSSPITAALPSTGQGFTAVGGFFGNLHRAGVATTITVAGASGVLDSRVLLTEDMGAGTLSNFFGWTVLGDTIVSITHDLEGGFVNTGDFDAIDDFQFGNVVPEPTAFVVWSLLAGIGIIAARRMR